MALTLEEVKHKLMRLDEVIVLEVLDLNAEDIIDRFEDKIIDRLEELAEELVDL
jgi:hypothetical protein